MNGYNYYDDHCQILELTTKANVIMREPQNANATPIPIANGLGVDKPNANMPILLSRKKSIEDLLN
jgi:hypothetical protein